MVRNGKWRGGGKWDGVGKKKKGRGEEKREGHGGDTPDSCFATTYINHLQ